MPGPSPLDRLEGWLDTVEADPLVDPDTTLPPAPALDGAELVAADLPRARQLLARLDAVTRRADGQRTRLAGELAGLPKRPRNTGFRRSSRTFDQKI